jgi:esterase/lipase superfamily enzyme
MSGHRGILLAVLAALLVGCAAQKEFQGEKARVGAPPPAPAPAPPPAPSTRRSVPEAYAPTIAPVPLKGAIYPVWYGTNRAPIVADGRTIGYSGDMDTREVRYGKVFVEIPEDFLQQLRYPGILDRIFFRSAVDSLKARRPIELPESVVMSEIGHDLAAIDPTERTALIYLHGFKTGFEDAAKRAAALGYQMKIPATAFFSWPSEGALAAYLADNTSISASEDQIAAFLIDFVRQSGATEVHVVAHSMGSYGLLRAMLRPVMTAAISEGVRFGQIILAAPDVDRRLFERDARILAMVSKRVTLYASSNDYALKVSMALANFQRAGILPPPVEVPGVDVIDVGPVDLTFLGHSYVVEEIAVMEDMVKLITGNTPPSRRSRIVPGADRRSWILK